MDRLKTPLTVVLLSLVYLVMQEHLFPWALRLLPKAFSGLSLNEMIGVMVSFWAVLSLAAALPLAPIAWAMKFQARWWAWVLISVHFGWPMLFFSLNGPQPIGWLQAATISGAVASIAAPALVLSLSNHALRRTVRPSASLPLS